jgi:hypothetical protein
MDAFGEGNYKFIDKQNIIANFGGREHSIKFNIDYTEFSSTRKDDLQIVNEKVIIPYNFLFLILFILTSLFVLFYTFSHFKCPFN